jgi:SAM-dependent methyltransferase
MTTVNKILRHILCKIWEPAHSKWEFIRRLPHGARVLDIGCGNNSPKWFKNVRPDMYYIGLDIGDYNQEDDAMQCADEYILTTGEGFAESIECFQGQMDAVVSAHNLEHCNDPNRVLIAMAKALKPGGQLYLSFPCEESINFPKRAGTLNFYDDPSHYKVPPWDDTLAALKRCGCTFDFTAKRYRPFPLVLKGLFLEPVSAIRKRVLSDSIWALYGFESVIWARRAVSENQKPVCCID